MLARGIAMLLGHLVTLPLSLQRKISSFRYFSFGVLIIILYSIVLTIVQAPFYY